MRPLDERREELTWQHDNEVNMGSKTLMVSNTQVVINKLAEELRRGLARPVYLCVERDSGGEISIRQVEFLTPAQLAELAHVSLRTVYAWIERAPDNGLKFYRPPGASGILFALDEVLDWIMSGERD
jgi:excisionase family DNA binding protein